MRKDGASTKRMPMYVLMVVCLVGLFIAIIFYLFFAPGKTKLVGPPSTSGLVAPADPAGHCAVVSGLV
ncbi:MAG TPA: hypothetical protein VGD59_04225 [Acidisarcina sp.]